MEYSSFLKAAWRKLVMANYVVDANLLEPFIPAGTVIDRWNDQCLVSLVGFMFLNTRVKGISIPFHKNFEEVNLRFYVKYNSGKDWKRGVVFIKEIVPRPALTFVANYMYGENYETLPMSHDWLIDNNKLEVTYRWKKGNWNQLKVIAYPTAMPILPESEAAFITEHYWGYTKLEERRSAEYEVVHPRWEIYEIKEHQIDVDFEMVYGKAFAFLSHTEPNSVMLAEGSAIEVRHARRFFV